MQAIGKPFGIGSEMGVVRAGLESSFLFHCTLALSTFCEELGNRFLVTSDIFLQKEITD